MYIRTIRIAAGLRSTLDWTADGSARNSIERTDLWQESCSQRHRAVTFYLCHSINLSLFSSHNSQLRSKIWYFPCIFFGRDIKLIVICIRLVRSFDEVISYWITMVKANFVREKINCFCTYGYTDFCDYNYYYEIVAMFDLWCVMVLTDGGDG